MKTNILKIAILALISWAMPSIMASQQIPVGLTSPIPAYVEKNWGVFNTLAESHINAPKAWELLHPHGARITVAVLDTGVDTAVPNLTSISSRYGFDFVKNVKGTTDLHGHGTHIAGIVAAVAHSRALIFPIKFYSESISGRENLKNTVRGIRYAVDHGARIINYSGGGPEFDADELAALKYAEANDVLVVAAAGNEGADCDNVRTRYYPGGYKLSNIITVAATDINNKILPRSNYGYVHVDVAAPGENIYSTLPGGRYGYMTGTSQATAFVTGIATLVLSERPNLSPADVKKIIIQSVDRIDSLETKVASGGRVNAYKALLLTPGQVPVSRLAKAFTLITE